MSDRAPLVRVQKAEHAAFMLSNLNSFPLDYVARFSVGGTDLSYFIIKQLSTLPPATLAQELFHGISSADFILPRVLELAYTAWDLESFAMDCGWSGPPFLWDDDRRFLIRCELDAAFFHLYLPGDEKGEWKRAKQADGCPHDETPEELAELKRHFPTPRHAVDYIMDTFPIVKRKDEAAHGHYRTKETILQIYDAMQQAIATGEPYKTLLDPPPADPSCCHPPKEEKE